MNTGLYALGSRRKKDFSALCLRLLQAISFERAIVTFVAIFSFLISLYNLLLLSISHCSSLRLPELGPFLMSSAPTCVLYVCLHFLSYNASFFTIAYCLTLSSNGNLLVNFFPVMYLRKLVLLN